MERFVVKRFFLGVIIPNIENEIYCSDYLYMVNLMTTSACCLLKGYHIRKGYQRFVGSFSQQKWYIAWLLNLYFELLLHIIQT